LPRSLDHQDMDRLFAVLADRIDRNAARPADLRLSALVELLYGSGLRATELVSLDVRAIAMDRPFTILKGKGGRERLVPVS
jgi:integrase/recombinase XerD